MIAGYAVEHLKELAETETTADKELRIVLAEDSTFIRESIVQRMEQCGFKHVRAFENGKEAHEILQKEKVDIMTLDIHMPEEDGLSYLKKNFKKDHPPVIMVSSVSSETSELALKALDLGASDYVEKPTLQNFESITEELRIKLNLAFRTSKEKRGRRTRCFR